MVIGFVTSPFWHFFSFQILWGKSWHGMMRLPGTVRALTFTPRKKRNLSIEAAGLHAGLLSSVVHHSFQWEYPIFNIFVFSPLPSFDWNLATALHYSSICLHKVVSKTQENSGGKWCFLGAWTGGRASQPHSARELADGLLSFCFCLQIILALGNYMNSSKRGAVYGFKLQSLDLVSGLKARQELSEAWNSRQRLRPGAKSLSALWKWAGTLCSSRSRSRLESPSMVFVHSGAPVLCQCLWEDVIDG